MTDIDQIMDRAVDRFAHETPRRSNGHAGPACVPDAPLPEPEDWPEPDMRLVESHRHQAPALPLEPFGEFWSRWIEAAAEAKGCPVDFVAMPLLASAGTIVANVRRASPWPGWVEPPIIWVANVGLPSSGKSPGSDAIIDLVSLLERELDADFDERRHRDLGVREECKARRTIWEAEVKTAVKKGLPPPNPPKDVDAPPPPRRKRLITNNCTTEQLAQISAANERGLIVFRDELAGWVGQMDKYGGNGADRAAYIEAFGGRPHIVDRVKDGASIRVPYFSVGIIGGIQPDRLATMLLHGDDDGLVARILFSWPEPRKPIRPHRSPDNEAALGALRWLLPLAQEQLGPDMKGPRILPFHPDAADCLQEWREQVAAMEPGAAGLFLSWLGKLPGLAVRLALVLELLWWSARTFGGMEEPAQVSASAVDAAVKLIVSYFVPMARRTFGEAALPQSDRDATTLARWLLAQAPVPGIINARELRHADALPTREADRYDTALAEMTLAYWVKPAPHKAGPGRTRKDFLVHPRLAGASAS